MSSLRKQGPQRERNCAHRGAAASPVARWRAALATTSTRGLWGGRPPTASMCQNEVVEISDKGAVREPDYPNWNGYVEAYFSSAWGGCVGAAGVAQATGAQANAGIFCRAAADRDRDGGLRELTLLGTRA